MKITMFMPVSVDGMVVERTDKFPDDFPRAAEYWKEFHHGYDCSIWGDVDRGIMTFSDHEAELGKHTFSSISEALDGMEQLKYKSAAVSVDLDLCTKLAKLKLIDEVVLMINPNIIGKGTPMFSPSDLFLKLELISVDKEDRYLLVKYKVIKN